MKSDTWVCLIPLPSSRKVLENAKHLNLSRLQMLSIMSLADVEVGTSSLMNYRKFATSAAKMINKLFDVNEQRVRTEVRSRKVHKYEVPWLTYGRA